MASTSPPSDILGLLEDPLRADPWDRRGLVVGHVQSGKTSNYTGLICKAADAGYKIIIVLAGLHNNLRSQTQIRLEEGFLGYETTANAATLARPSAWPSSAKTCKHQLRDDARGERRLQQGHRQALPASRPRSGPGSSWSRSNKTVLDASCSSGSRATTSPNAQPMPTTGRRIVTKLPLLLIDDEADNASVDTGEQVFNEDGNAGRGALSPRPSTA